MSQSERDVDMKEEDRQQTSQKVIDIKKYRRDKSRRIWVVPKVSTEVKQKMSVFLTPSDRRALLLIAESTGMTTSELLAYWVHQAILSEDFE